MKFLIAILFVVIFAGADLAQAGCAGGRCCKGKNCGRPVAKVLHPFARFRR